MFQTGGYLSLNLLQTGGYFGLILFQTGGYYFLDSNTIHFIRRVTLAFVIGHSIGILMHISHICTFYHRLTPAPVL